jgi:hypothetical protein
MNEPKYGCNHQPAADCPYRHVGYNNNNAESLLYNIACATDGCVDLKGMKYCFMTSNNNHIPFCRTHMNMKYILCEKCYSTHHYLKNCQNDKKYHYIIKKQKKLENMIKYLPGSVDYTTAKEEFDNIAKEIN